MTRPSLVFLSAVLLAMSAGCAKKDAAVNSPLPATSTTCVGCHSDAATLKAVADPSPPPPGDPGGCGGTFPELDAWQKVYIGGPNGQKFLDSRHGRVACTTCHGGVEPADGKRIAHTGTFEADPSRNAPEHCGPCHAELALKDQTNIHTQGSGMKHMVALRGGFAGYDQFPDALKRGYDAYCGTCHASCGECHVQRPRRAGGGLLSAHLFRRTPDMRLNCLACHSAAIADDYFGGTFGSRPDVHYSKLPNGVCTNCHSSKDMHGDGTVRTQRYDVQGLSRCVDCHAAKAKANRYHTTHWNTMSCYVCHSQDYQNCGSCHVGAEGIRNGPYSAFKIGMNVTAPAKGYKFAVVRHTPAAADSWDAFGLPAMPDFKAAPTYTLASPHNIRRWTVRTATEAGKPCSDACHIINGRNRQWYLFVSDLPPWETSANRRVVVDDHLPYGWY